MTDREVVVKKKAGVYRERDALRQGLAELLKEREALRACVAALERECEALRAALERAFNILRRMPPDRAEVAERLARALTDGEGEDR